MTSRTVVSPARELIEIVDDDDWLATTGDRKVSLAQFLGPRSVLGALWNYGKYEDASGRATMKLHTDAAKLGYRGSNQAINGVLARTAMQPAIDREKKGKRTFSLRLIALPETWYRKLDAEWPHVNGSTPDTSTAEPMRDDQTHREAAETVAALIMSPVEEAPADDIPTIPPDEPIPDYAPPVNLQIASSVAMALLTQCVEIITAGSPAETDQRVKQLKSDLDDVAGKLAARLDENNRMRKSIRDMSDEVLALRQERDGLRRRLRAAEINLERATSADTQRFINEQVQAELAKVMRSTPVARPLKGDPD